MSRPRKSRKFDPSQLGELVLDGPVDEALARAADVFRKPGAPRITADMPPAWRLAVFLERHKDSRSAYDRAMVQKYRAALHAIAARTVDR